MKVFNPQGKDGLFKEIAAEEMSTVAVYDNKIGIIPVPHARMN